MRIKEENQTLATVTLQNYFRMYDKLAGMTGTASTEAGEFADTYGLEVVTIPTNRPMVRGDAADLIYKSETASSMPSPTTSPSATPMASRSSWARSRSRSPSCSSPVRREAWYSAPGAEREAARAGGARRRPGGPSRQRHRRHQHGGPRRRHPARWQSEGLAENELLASGTTIEESPERYEELVEKFGGSVRATATRCGSSGASTCSAPNATRAAASTTSSVAAPAAG